MNDYHDKQKVLLFFYSGDFIGEATNPETIRAGAAASLCALSSETDKFESANTRILAVSRDSPDRHAKLADLLALQIPMLSDEKGAVGEQYGLLPENRWAGSSDSYDIYNCAFIINVKGMVRSRQKFDVVLSPDNPMPDFVRVRFESSERLRLGEPTVLHTTKLLHVAEEIT